MAWNLLERYPAQRIPCAAGDVMKADWIESAPRPSRRRRFISAAASLIWLAGAAYLAWSVVAPTPARSESHSDRLDLSRYRGKVVYLDFWASWCGPCKLSFPYMEEMTASYSKNSFVVIAVNVDHSRQRADAFLNQVDSTLPVIYDPNGKIAGEYHVSEMPTSILIGKDGRIRFIHKGFFANKTAEYEAHIEELISEK